MDREIDSIDRPHKGLLLSPSPEDGEIFFETSDFKQKFAHVPFSP